MGNFRRAVGLVILGAALVAAVGLWLLVIATEPSSVGQPAQRELLGWSVPYDIQMPPMWQVGLAIALALTFALAVSWLERRVATAARRTERRLMPLAPKRVMAETRGVFAGPVTVTAVIPAHNEEARLGDTLRSLRRQTRRPDRILVVADNCTDGTLDVARSEGVEFVETVDNTQKKAGALNQVLRTLLRKHGDNDLVLVMDADTVLGDDFINEAVRRMTEDRALMAIGGLFYGEEGGGLLGQFQRNEYTRYARDLKRRRGMLFVLTGTASIFRPRALLTVADERGGILPGVPGDIYDTVALTEDNEITLALKSLGGLVVSPQTCTVVTELMPTWRDLWAQRLRWQRGALENLGDYGVRMQTWRYWVQQLAISYGTLALAGYLGLMAVTVLALDSWVWFPFWMVIGGVFAVERVATVWRGGWRARLLAVLLLPELMYASFLAAVHTKGVFDITFGRAASWHYVPPVPSVTRVAEGV